MKKAESIKCTHTHSHTSENSVSEMYTNNVPHATIKANENNGDDDGDDDDDDEKLTYKNIWNGQVVKQSTEYNDARWQQQTKQLLNSLLSVLWSGNGAQCVHPIHIPIRHTPYPIPMLTPNTKRCVVRVCVCVCICVHMQVHYNASHRIVQICFIFVFGFHFYVGFFLPSAFVCMCLVSAFDFKRRGNFYVMGAFQTLKHSLQFTYTVLTNTS